MNLPPRPRVSLSLLAGLLFLAAAAQARAPLVLLTDFGTQDGAVSAMKGVAYGVSQDLLISDLSHENPSIFAGAYRLYQAEQFWPAATVFVAVVDPGVGTERLSIVLKTRTGHYFVGPNNGLLSLVAERDGIEGLRQIDEHVNRRPGSEESHTFHGRDVFAYTGARLAAGVISFEQVGPPLRGASVDFDPVPQGAALGRHRLRNHSGAGRAVRQRLDQHTEEPVR